MSKRVLLSMALIGAAAIFAQAQTSQTPQSDTTHSDVYLDNHRPLIQKREKPPTARTVTGKVVDDSGQPVEGALVTLTNDSTKDQRQAVTKKDGRYNFDDVSFTIDYEVKAQYKNLSSEPRKLSQYDHSAKVVRILELQPAATAPEQAKK